MKWDDYFRETTLHGFKYVASDWPGSVRNVWAAVIAVDLCVSWFIVSDLFAADVRNPVTTTIGSVSADKVQVLLNKKSGKSWNYWILLAELLSSVRHMRGSREKKGFCRSALPSICGLRTSSLKYYKIDRIVNLHGLGVKTVRKFERTYGKIATG